MIPVSEPNLSGNELKYVTEAIKSGWVSSQGEFIKKFEQKFGEYCGMKYGVACSNGTAALHLALLALGIKQGDEVIIPDLTFAATANVVIYTGATPILVDVDKETWNIDTEKIEEKISAKTKAIISVHLYGLPCDMEKIMEIARKHNLYVIEDAAEAHGAEINGKKVGSFGIISCFSFYGNKIITTGEGGICLTNDQELDRKMRILRDHGMKPEKKYWHDEVGWNYRMTNIQAALGIGQLEQIDKFIEKKIENAKYYTDLLKDIPGIKFQKVPRQMKHVYWMFCILVKDRDKLMAKLKEAGIDTRPLFYPLHEMKPYKTDEKFPISQELSYSGINLPSSTKLTKEDIEYISNVIKSSI